MISLKVWENFNWTNLRVIDNLFIIYFSIVTVSVWARAHLKIQSPDAKLISSIMIFQIF